MKPTAIHAIHPLGWPVTITLEPSDPKLAESIQQLARLGFRPNAAGDAWPRTPEGLPICPKHGLVMQKREKQGDIWYSHQITDPATGEITYCRGYPSPNSPGYEIQPKPHADSPPRPVAPPPTNGKPKSNGAPTPAKPTPHVAAPATASPIAPPEVDALLADLNAELFS